ncbi:integrase core domain protein [Ceratobasidium sp. AG-Ba]|nr:integrase core domain protein [Ceratobasidium sp. AG-Ba]QRV97437.1 integrase core domain protein [Ceratobasidium sp. AG-Ba]
MGTIQTECLSTLERLEAVGLGSGFTDAIMDEMTGCFVELEQALSKLQDVPSPGQGLIQLEPVQHVCTTGPGRARKIVDPDVLHEAFSTGRNISIARLAKTLRISRPTLYKNMEENNIQRTGFSPISTTELNSLVQDFKLRHPKSGFRMAMAHLRNKGIRVPRDRILNSIRQVDGLGVVERTSRPAHQRIYSVPHPNYLWHHDGHHKLGPWGIVIHGFTDGFDRMIVAMRAANNNRASTVLKLFLDAIELHGTPSRCRGDRGGENIAVAIFMTLLRGKNRGSYLWGSSTNNQKIERLWLDVGKQFARYWKAFFLRLELLHGLDRFNTHHIWLLHHLFLADINTDITSFADEWNVHGISGSKTQGQSPQVGLMLTIVGVYALTTSKDLRFLGQLTEGVHEDVYADISPEILEQFLGVDDPGDFDETTSGGDNELFPGSQSQFDITPEDPDDISLGDLSSEAVEIALFLREQLRIEQNKHVRHPGVPVSSQACPFESNTDVQEFSDICHLALEDGFLPAGYGIQSTEWENGIYPGEQYIGTDRKVDQTLFIPLPHEIWYPRAAIWVIGLHVMNAMTGTELD